MQETIKFELSSRTAIIKKPESNETYYTYNFPHKIMLLGILGAIIGLNGYNYYSFKKYLQQPVEELPEFYAKLNNLKIAIIPNMKSKNFNTKIQTFNNSVGYASKEEGNNLVVKEQWLENPSWDIYILGDESEEYKKIKEYLINNKCEYIPYIGKNDHFANIRDIEIKTVTPKKSEHINSIFDETILSDYIDEFEEMFAFGIDFEKEPEYKYKEILPTKLNEKIGYTDFKPFIYTNKKLNVNDEAELYLVEDRILYYF